ncbi:transaldolase [Agrococcus sp. ARC_14]|uniref:transaldolase n=1 Tax=Agrococcus sp. ARC_14 TaxID=2919927 RepID=UPI001F06EC1D|nr:transaldolase [Agrococcus sp. ARC_14]MCH1883147.1 transaldolase [Agrococcus sp. ARC_14]
MNENTTALSAAGVSIWLDDLSRERLTSGSLAALITERNVVGVTTNPTIFANAIAAGESYEAAVRELAGNGATVDEVITALTTSDVADACDIFADVYTQSGGVDGRVSIEVEPGLARDTAGTIAQAAALHERVARENVLIKIPATQEGLEAIATTTAAGISVNVTLIFSLDRYRDVINAYLTGLERAQQAGIDLSKIHSVASFFVSRVDSEIDKRLDAIGTEEATALKSKAGIANARLAYRVWQEAFSTERAQTLLAAGANTQRPLWASTGVKDPSLPDTLYVTELVAPQTVNTMPEKTLEALADHGRVTGDTIASGFDDAEGVLDALDSVGVSYTDVVALLETEGLEKFDASWGELVQTVQDHIDHPGAER